jgi:hypothetical protein
MWQQIRWIGVCVAGAVLMAACSESPTSPATAAVARASGSTTGGGGTSGGGGGGGGGTVKVDDIKVSKCYTNATATGFGQLLIKAASSDPTATLYAYRPDGTFQGEVQNGGGSRYGGTVMGYLPYDPGYMVIRSSSGGVVNAPTTPFFQ